MLKTKLIKSSGNIYDYSEDVKPHKLISKICNTEPASTKIVYRIFEGADESTLFSFVSWVWVFFANDRNFRK